MGAIVPIAAQALTAFQVIDRGIGLFDNKSERSDRLALEQLQARQTIDQQRLAQSNELSRQEITLRAEQAENTRRDALKRAVARQRAQFGASGVSANGGSSEAVLLGLFDESDEQRAERERLDNLRLGALDQNLSNQNRINTLELSQKAEKDRLKNSTTTLEDISGVFNIF